MFLAIGRAIKQSLKNLWRNGWLSIAAISVLILSLYSIGAIFVLVMTADNVLGNVESKINVSVYFNQDVNEERILQIKKELESNQQIKTIEYISREQALEDFKKNNANEPVIMQSLEEIGENPLSSSLIIKANKSDQYQSIVTYINDASFNGDIKRINYEKNKNIIDKLNWTISKIKKIGLILAIGLGIISILIIFNTIRITIYTHKQEIEIMRLVGSSNMFIRLPFIFEGIIYGIIASIFSTILLFVTVKLISPYVSSIVASENLVAFYISQVLFIFGVQVAGGILLGILSSWIAMRKYLRV